MCVYKVILIHPVTPDRPSLADSVCEKEYLTPVDTSSLLLHHCHSHLLTIIIKEFRVVPHSWMLHSRQERYPKGRYLCVLENFFCPLSLQFHTFTHSNTNGAWCEGLSNREKLVWEHIYQLTGRGTTRPRREEDWAPVQNASGFNWLKVPFQCASRLHRSPHSVQNRSQI